MPNQQNSSFLAQGTQVSSLWSHSQAAGNRNTPKARLLTAGKEEIIGELQCYGMRNEGRDCPFLCRQRRAPGFANLRYPKAKVKFRANQRTCKQLSLIDLILLSWKIQFSPVEKPEKFFPCLALAFKIVTVPNGGNSQNPSGLQQMHPAPELSCQVHCFGFPLPSI